MVKKNMKIQKLHPQIQWSGTCWNSPSEVKCSRLLSPNGPGTKKKAQHFTGLFSISKTIRTKFKRVALAPLLGDLLRPSALSSTKQHPEQEAVMQHIWSCSTSGLQHKLLSHLHLRTCRSNQLEPIGSKES